MLLFYVLVFWLQGMWELSYPTRDWSLTPCIGRWSLNRWTAREVLSWMNSNFALTNKECQNVLGLCFLLKTEIWWLFLLPCPTLWDPMDCSTPGFLSLTISWRSGSTMKWTDVWYYCAAEGKCYLYFCHILSCCCHATVLSKRLLPSLRLVPSLQASQLENFLCSQCKQMTQECQAESFERAKGI